MIAVGRQVNSSTTRSMTRTSSALAVAATARPEPGATPETIARDAQAAADVVADIVTHRTIRRARKATVLWVDESRTTIFGLGSLLRHLG